MFVEKTIPFRLVPLAMIATILQAPVCLARDMSLPVIEVEGQAEDMTPPGADVVDAVTLSTLRARTSDVASLLRDVPGVTLYTAGGVSSLPAIHGLADDRLRIKVDGMDLIASCPNHMNPPLSYLDPGNIGSLQVFAGIAPVSVGGDSIGGTIIAETPAPEFAEPGAGPLAKGEVQSSYRSNNDAIGAGLSATGASEDFSLRYSGGWSRADNYTAGADFKTSKETGRVGHTLPLDEVASTAYETWNHSLDMALKSAGNLFTAKLGYQDMPEQLYPNQRMDLLDNTQQRARLGWLRDFDGGDIDVSVYHERIDHFMDFGPDKRFWYGSNAGMGVPCSPIRYHGDPAGTCAGGMPMYSEGRTTGFAIKPSFDLSPSAILRTGLEYQRYRLDDYWTASGGGMGPGNFLNIHDGERDRLGLFGEWESQLNAQWLTLFGVRYERVSSDAGNVHGYSTDAGAPGNQVLDAAAFNAQDHGKTDSNWDVTALARYRHDDHFSIEAGVARKVRSPNLYERYTWSTWPMAAVMNNFVGDGNGYIGDIDLKPEQAHTLSLTFDWHADDRRWELKATPYYTRVSDYIDAVSRAGWVADRFNVLQFANQSARIYGLDLSGHMPIADTAWGNWGLEGLVAYTDGKNRDSGDALYNIMPLHARLTLTHTVRGWSNAVEWIAVDAKDDVSSVRNEIETAGYGLVNVRASHQWRQVRVDVGIDNVLDKFYVLPTGGAYVAQGMTMSMDKGVPWGVGVPGMGRSYYVGLNIKF